MGTNPNIAAILQGGPIDTTPGKEISVQGTKEPMLSPQDKTILQAYIQQASPAWAQTSNNIYDQLANSGVKYSQQVLGAEQYAGIPLGTNNPPGMNPYMSGVSNALLGQAVSEGQVPYTQLYAGKQTGNWNLPYAELAVDYNLGFPNVTSQIDQAVSQAQQQLKTSSPATQPVLPKTATPNPSLTADDFSQEYPLTTLGGFGGGIQSVRG
jgi:hypothetical protein